jgi:hypothetical protein
VSNVRLEGEHVFHLSVQLVGGSIQDGQIAGFPRGSGLTSKELPRRILDDS